jgi:hypothetical protein
LTPKGRAVRARTAAISAAMNSGLSRTIPRKPKPAGLGDRRDEFVARHPAHAGEDDGIVATEEVADRRVQIHVLAPQPWATLAAAPSIVAPDG